MATDNNNTVVEPKEWVKIISDFKDSTAEALVEHAQKNHNIEVDLSNAKTILAGKSYALDVTLDWDKDKTLDENIAHIGGVLVEGTIATMIGAGVATALLSNPGAISIFLTGLTIGIGAKIAGIDIGDFTEKMYKQFDTAQTQKYLDFQLLSPEDKARYITNGGVPWGYASSSSVVVRSDPLVLDLNHDGIVNSISLSSSKTFFDMNNDGMSELTGWISADDGMVVYDKNQDGISQSDELKTFDE